MNGRAAWIPRLLASVTLSAAVAAGHPAFARAVHHRVAARAAKACCRVPAGTKIEVQLADRVTTAVQRSGDAVALRLAAPLIVNREIVLRAGTPGVGVVVEAAKPGIGGKGAKLIIAGRYIEARGRQVPLQGLQLAAAGRDNTMAAQAVGLTGIAFAPLGFVGLAIPGGQVVLPAGTTATAKVAEDVLLAPLGRASRDDVASAEAFSAAAEFVGSDAASAIDLPPPQAGDGEVIFFRPKSLLGTGQWFKVRENGKALGKLSNGAYFVQVTSPGLHVYTAAEEPELKDRLKLEVDPGETYFVEGTLTKGVVVGAADLTPADRAAFDRASRHLKLTHSLGVGEQTGNERAGSGASAGSTARARVGEGQPALNSLGQPFRR